MARIWKLSGSPLLLILLLSSPFIVLVVTGQIKGLKIFGGSVFTGYQAVAFDSQSGINRVSAYNCNNGLGSGWFAYGEASPNNYQCQQTTSSTFTVAGTTSSTINLPIADIGSDSNDGSYLGVLVGPNCNGFPPVCAHASFYLPGPPSPPPVIGGGGRSYPTSIVGTATSGYQVAGSISYPYNKVGSDQNFLNTFNEPVPRCNPCITPGPTTNSSIYWLEYGFAVRLQIQGDGLVQNVQCYAGYLVPISNSAPACPPSQVSAANQALSFVNSYNAASGKVLIDLTIPLSLANGPNDKFGIVGAWIAQRGFSPSSTSYGGQFGINPGSNHVIVPFNNAPFSPFSYKDLSAWTWSNLPSVLPTTVTMPITFNIQPKYTAIANGNNLGINADYGMSVDIPIVFVLADQSSSPPPNGGGGGGIIGPGGCGGIPICPIYGNTTSNISVHVQDSMFNLPLSGVQVAAVSDQAAACSASGGATGTTDGSGNYVFQALSTAGSGSYLVCATGTSGTLTLIFISFQITYSCNGASCTTQANIGAGKSASVTLALPISFAAQLTTLSIGLILVGLVLFVVVIIVAPTSLLALGGGARRALRSGRRR